MDFDQEKVKRWLVHLGLLQKNENWYTCHVSGHAPGNKIREMIAKSKAKHIIPMHTTNPKVFENYCDNVIVLKEGKKFSL